MWTSVTWIYEGKQPKKIVKCALHSKGMTLKYAVLFDTEHRKQL